MHITRRSWDRMAMKTTHDVIRELKDNLPPDKPTISQRIFTWLDDFVKNTLGIGQHWRTEADFKAVELLFKTKFYLDRTFDYNRYLAFVLEDVVVNLSELVRARARHPWLFCCIARTGSALNTATRAWSASLSRDQSTYHWLAVMGLCYLAEETLDAGQRADEEIRMQAEEKYLLAMEEGRERLGMEEGGSEVDDNSGIRRRLGAAAEEDQSDCKFFSDSRVGVPIPCGMDDATIYNLTAELFTTAELNVTGE
eukprot:COSAG02_NODE_3288_length_7000_cov_1414.390958_7_plen_253_part_00